MEAGIFRAAVAETGTPLEEVPGDTTDRVPALAAVAALPAWDLAAEGSAVVAAGGAGRRLGCGTES